MTAATGTDYDTGVHMSLVERYARMAHTYEPRPVDTVLRALDVALAGAALVALSPLLGLAALAIRLSGRGPVLYRGRRVGKGGQVFTMLKFRTLRPDAERRLGASYGAELTARTQEEVSRVGRVLRVTKLDETPQLINIVRGDMSLVGPRPIRPAFFEQLCREIPAYWQRLVVAPGATGLAQLRLTREMTWAEKLHHDFEYIADRSVGLYFSILVATFWLVVRLPFSAVARQRRGI